MIILRYHAQPLLDGWNGPFGGRMPSGARNSLPPKHYLREALGNKTLVGGQVGEVST